MNALRISHMLEFISQNGSFAFYRFGESLMLKWVFGQMGAVCATIVTLGFSTIASAAQQSRGAPDQTVTAQMDEGALLAKLNQLRGAATSVDMFAPEALELTINGWRYVDPEGLLANVTVDPDTGDATFFVGRTHKRALKFLSGHSPGQPLTIGEITAGEDGFSFSSITGVHILGQKLITLPDGLVIWRDDALFLYQYGKGAKSFALPSGFYPTDLQRNNIWQTGHILMRRDFRSDSDNEKGFRATKQLFGALVGRSKSEDFALYDFQRDKMLMLPFEDVGQGRDGALMSSVRTPDLSHYFWRVQWVTVGTRRFAVYLKNGTRQVAVTDLDSGKTAIAMSRDLGINGFDLKREGPQTVRVTASWMFKNHDIPDLVPWFDAAPAEPKPQ
jgi:hypothetical protein